MAFDVIVMGAGTQDAKRGFGRARRRPYTSSDA